MARRVSILAKLLGVYLIATVATFAGFGVLAHYVARRTLEEELGRRLMAVAAGTAAQIAPETVSLLGPGDEATRAYRGLKRRLETLVSATGSARIFVFDLLGTSRCDTRPDVQIGERYYALVAARAELRQVAAGMPAASVLFRGNDGALYKSGFAPLRDDTGQVRFMVGVDGAAALYEQLAGFRRTLLLAGCAGVLAVVVLSVLMAHFLTRPIRRLETAARRIGEGDLEQPIAVTSRDEVGFLAETLEAMRRHLRARDERMQMMLAGIAHEVRNPLGGMELYAGLLRDELVDQPTQLELLQRIDRELGHLNTIVSEFLDYARRGRPLFATADLAVLLSEVQELTLGAATQRRVTLKFDAAAAAVRCDGGQLRRALLNLVHNAIQACPSDGTGAVQVTCRIRQREAIVTITDSGSGMDAITLQKMWTPFFTTKQRGIGLGLAFVRDIAHDHGARLEVESRPQQGTTFTLALPEA